MNDKTTMETKPRVKIKNWSLVSYLSSPYQAPETAKHCLNGFIIGHSGFTDETFVRTSSIVSLDIPNKICETNNTLYLLGEPDKSFTDWLETNDKTLDDYSVFYKEEN